MLTLNQTFTRYPLLRFIGALIVSLLGTLGIILLTLNLTSRDISQLVVYMSGTGLMTLIISYTFYRLGVVKWFSSLRWTMAATIILTVGLIVMNVWVIARVMFIEYHYVSLTTALLIFAGLSAIIFSYFISRTMTDRICALSDAAEQLASGDLSTRLTVEGNDELAQLSSTFNMMAQNLEQLDEQKRQLDQSRRDLIAWVSHDLRTPLATMRVMIEALSDGVVSDAETTQRYLNNSRAEIEHLNRMINDLFELAQIDVGHIEMDFAYASLPDMISDTIGSMSAKAHSHQITLSGEVAPDVDLAYIAPDKIQRVLYNLVNNALDYTPAGENVTIKAHTESKFVCIEVYNSGVYIDRDAQPQLFNSFYRGERSRARSNEGIRGTGLGLAIAKAFVEANGGQIWLTSDPKDGTTFSFTVPRYKQGPLL